VIAGLRNLAQSSLDILKAMPSNVMIVMKGVVDAFAVFSEKATPSENVQTLQGIYDSARDNPDVTNFLSLVRNF
jgi:hypothetical protein